MAEDLLPIGNAALEYDGDTTIFSLLLSRQYRNKGIGNKVVRTLIARVRAQGFARASAEI